MYDPISKMCATLFRHLNESQKELQSANGQGGSITEEMSVFDTPGPSAYDYVRKSLKNMYEIKEIIQIRLTF
jgi:hypothetical protein